MIKSLDAFFQPLQFDSLYKYCTTISDVDGIVKLNNNKLAVIEIKKDTPNHDFINIEKSPQWALLRQLAQHKDTFLIYATHNQVINKDVLIDAQDCIVKRLEVCGEKRDFVPGESLKQCIARLSRPTTYKIIIEYPNGELAYAITNPCGNKWYTKTFNATVNTFLDKELALQYITARKTKPFNKNNKYHIVEAN